MDDHGQLRTLEMLGEGGEEVRGVIPGWRECGIPKAGGAGPTDMLDTNLLLQVAFGCLHLCHCVLPSDPLRLLQPFLGEGEKFSLPHGRTAAAPNLHLI